jgi:YesN/AraC family two-component response regulator
LPRRYRLLWIDATVSRSDADAAHAFKDSFEIHRYPGLTTLDSEIERVNPAVICFEFDFPTKVSLKLLQGTKQAHPQIPVLMLTVQHSESLAVWAFRSKVWDYLVIPVASAEIERCIVGLHELLQVQALQKQARALTSIRTLIPEENRADGIRGNAALQLAYALDFVDKHYREKISSSEVAQQCSLSTFQFSRLFRATYGVTFQEYVLRYRIREACRLLKNPTTEIAEVASLAGFNDPSYFGKIFRRYMACTPSQYQLTHDAPLDSSLVEDLTRHSAPTEH